MFASNAFLATWTPRTLALLRIVAGLLFLQHATAKLFLVEGGLSEDKEIDLEHGLEMDGVEAPMIPDRFTHPVTADVEVAFEPGSKCFHLVRAKLDDEISVTRTSRLAIGRTRERTSRSSTQCRGRTDTAAA